MCVSSAVAGSGVTPWASKSARARATQFNQNNFSSSQPNKLRLLEYKIDYHFYS
jgi:hypothetical protein